MESIDLLVQKYVSKVELSIKLLPCSPHFNEKSNVERNDGYIIYKFGFTTKRVWRNYPYCIREQQKVVFLERKRFCLIRMQSFPYDKWKGRKSNLKYFKVWG